MKNFDHDARLWLILYGYIHGLTFAGIGFKFKEQLFAIPAFAFVASAFVLYIMTLREVIYEHHPDRCEECRTDTTNNRA